MVLCDKELEHLGDLHGKKACVLGSGDNQVVFALAGMGARVTSVDISQKQLDVAKGRAAELGLEVAFVRADVTDLTPLGDESFELVYTGGHVAVWVSDLRAYYREAGRILSRGGLFLVNEYHPFRRIWKRSVETFAVAASYFDRGPHEERLSSDVLEEQPGDYLTYKFHWTVADYIGAVLEAGCRICAVHEYDEECGDWEGSPLAGLPQFLLIIAQKEAAQPERRAVSQPEEIG